MRLQPEDVVSLVTKAQSGDEAAFEALVRAFYDSLHYYVGRFTSNHDVRDDIMQTIWISVFCSLKQLRHPEAFVTWLYRIAHNKTMSGLKLNRQLESRFPVSLDEGLVTLEEEAVDDYAEDDAPLIHTGLLELSPEQREVLVLRFMEELDYASIARITDVSLGTVRSRIHYAKAALREIIARLRGSDHG